MIRYALPIINFTISKPTVIGFEFQSANIGECRHTHYEGEYIVTPHAYAQTLPTDDKVCDDNITVLSIPMAKVSNPKGGYTATIG